MSAFDLLFVVSAVLALAALLRLRTATFIFAGNQAITLRSLALIQEHGRPPILGYVPGWVFHPQYLHVAVYIFAISTGLLAAFVALPARKHAEVDAGRLPRLPKAAVVSLAAYFVVLAFSSRTVLNVDYASAEQDVYFAPAGGVQTFAAAAMLYELYRRVRTGEMTAWVAFSIVSIVFLFTDLLKGQTGMASGFLISAAILLFGGTATSARKRWLSISMLLAGIIASTSLLRLARHDIYDEGYSAFTTAAGNLAEREAHSGESGQGAETASSGHEFAALTLECVALYESGHDREWRSLYLPVVYTFQPAFLMQIMGWQRQQEAAWEIREYFTTNGAVTIFGESYWNGGYLGVLVILSLVLVLSYLCDTNYRTGFVGLVFYCNFAPCLLQGVGYGLSYEFRGIANTVLQLGIYYAYRWLTATVAKRPLPVR